MITWLQIKPVCQWWLSLSFWVLLFWPQFLGSSPGAKPLPLSHKQTHTNTHTAGLLPVGTRGLARPLLSPCCLLAVISHSTADTPSITEAELLSALAANLQHTCQQQQQHHIWLCTISLTMWANFSWCGQTLRAHSEDTLMLSWTRRLCYHCD